MSVRSSRLADTCALCFSRDRRLRPISAEHWDILETALDNVPLGVSVPVWQQSRYMLCWECATQLRHAAEFTRRVQRALPCFEDYLTGNKKSLPSPPSRLAVSRVCRTELASTDVTPHAPLDVTCHVVDKGTYHVVDSELKREDVSDEFKEDLDFMEPHKCLQESSDDIALKQEDHNLETERSRTEQNNQEDSIGAEDLDEYLPEESRIEEKLKEERKKKKEVKKKSGKSDGKAHYSRQWMSTEQALRWYEIECRGDTSDPSDPSAPSVACALCRRAFAAEDELRQHSAEIHHESCGPYECSICHYRFTQQTSLLEHTERHYVLYTCHGCRHEARSLSRAREHAVTCHGTRQIKSDQDGKGAGGRRKRKGDGNSTLKKKKEKKDCYQCRRCKEIFESFVVLREHRPSCSTYKCDSCQQTFNNSGALYRHGRVHRSSPEPLQYCATCDTHYKSSWFKKHFEISLKHVTRDAYKHECPHCKRRFLVLRRLKEHIGSVHLKLGIHKCDRCPKSYMNEKVLKMHQAKIHSVDKVEKKRDKICEHCGKGFTCNLYLSNHRRSHTGERPFACSLCSRAFAQSGTLYTHIKTVHRKRLARDGCTDCPGYQCEECGKQFVTNARLKAHYNFYHLKDTDYKCLDCDKMFISVAALKCHLANRHATLTTKSLACSSCGKEFRTASARHTHMKTPRPGGVYCV